MKNQGVWLKKNILAIVGISSVLLIVLFKLAQERKTVSPVPQDSMNEIIRKKLVDRQVVPLQLADNRIWVEVVTTPESITQGLSGRTDIGIDTLQSAGQFSPTQGMMFVLLEKRIPTFWMKDMKFDLDIVWIDDGQVVDISENIPHPANNQSDLPIYSPNQAVDMVLEVPAGSVKDWGIKIGDLVLFPTLGLSD